MSISYSVSDDKNPEMLLLERHGIVPEIVTDDHTRADDLADALVAGGLPLAKVTLRTRMGPETIRRMAGRGEMLHAAGTVPTSLRVDKVVAVIPDIATATELQTAAAEGLSRVKFSPAGQGGKP